MCVYDIVVCVVNYIYYHKYTCGYFNRVIYIVSPIVILIGLLQVLSPNTMLSGTATAATLLVIFINLQQERNNTDNLTGLINRDGFYEVITNYTKHHIPFRMVIVCIRGFKSINNHYGQKSADLFLKEIGSYIDTLFSDAVVCRLSGIEYAVILAGATEEGYKKGIDELIKRFDLPWVIQDIKCELSACFADAFFEEYTPKMEEITSFLEFSANLEKQYISGHMQHFNEDDKIQYIRRSHLVDLLDYSYKFDRFSLNFQPVYDCSTNDFSGVEALLRLKDTNGSLISPSEFIPLAEETGLIIDISWMVLNKVCCFLSENKDLPVDSISVNFSVQQFQDENMADAFLSIINKYEIPATKIKVEITERIISNNPSQVISIMETLRKEGIGFYLDDFGIGYSNLSRISKLPFECIKIDSSLIEMLDSQESIELFKAIIFAIKATGKKVLFEGIETEEHVKNVTKLELDMIQGFFYSRPLSEIEYIDFLKARS